MKIIQKKEFKIPRKKDVVEINRKGRNKKKWNIMHDEW